PPFGPLFASTSMNPAELLAAMTNQREPELGEWPAQAPEMPRLSVVSELGTGTPLASVHIVTVPTNDSTEIPAYLYFGGWNACPAPEFQVAALRSWRARFGAQLVGLGADVMNCRVTTRPLERAQALDLAREQYAFCPDLIEQGAGTMSALAAALM